MIIVVFIFQAENFYAGQLAQAEIVFNQPAIGQVDGSDDAIVGDPYAEETMPMDGENGVFTVNETQAEDDDDQDLSPRDAPRPSQRRDRQERQNEGSQRRVRQERQNERSQRHIVSVEDELDLNERRLRDTNFAHQLSQTFSDYSFEGEIPKKSSNLGFSHFFRSCAEFSFTSCNFSY